MGYPSFSLNGEIHFQGRPGPTGRMGEKGEPGAAIKGEKGEAGPPGISGYLDSVSIFQTKANFKAKLGTMVIYFHSNCTSNLLQ